MKFTDVNLLEELEKPEYAELKRRFVLRTFPKDALAFSPMEGNSRVFVICSGRARIYLSYADKEFTLAILGPGDVYSTHTRAGVQALTPLEVLVTDAATFRRSLAAFPEMTGTIIRVLGGVLSSTFGIISGMVFKDASQRLAEFLLSEAEESDEAADAGSAGVLIRPGLTVEQLAQLIGSTRQTVSTLLNDMIRSKVIERRARGEFAILSPRRLREYLEP
ncbi:MAG: Crp/Fnr family transcriptional regulator [Desulfovibrio sp.]